MPTAFRVTWDRVMCGKILKYDEDPDCEGCGDAIPDGKQYGCEYCGNEFCEECMMDEADGVATGYRGHIDSGHPIERHPEFNGGAYCPSCAVNMLAFMEDDYGGGGDNEPIPPYEPPPQQPIGPDSETLEEVMLRVRHQNISDDRLVAMTGDLNLDEQTKQEAIMELKRRMQRGSVEQRTNLGAGAENQMNTMARQLGRDPIIAIPPSMADREFGFPGDFTDKFASADAFTSAWDVVKRERV